MLTGDVPLADYFKMTAFHNNLRLFHFPLRLKIEKAIITGHPKKKTNGG